MKSLILFLALTAVCYAGDYKACVIKYKTDAGLCRQIEDVLNVKVPKVYSQFMPPNMIGDLWIEVPYDSVWYSPKGDTVYRAIGDNVRQFRGLAFEIVPDAIDSIAWGYDPLYRDMLYTSKKAKYGKAILIWEEVTK